MYTDMSNVRKKCYKKFLDDFCLQQLRLRCVKGGALPLRGRVEGAEREDKEGGGWGKRAFENERVYVYKLNT